VALRQLAIKQGYKLNEYGLFRGTRRIAGRTEEEIYARLGLAYIPPEPRQDQGEIDAARAGTLPRLIEADALRGDLQTQTDWTDGADSIEEMARAAKTLGLEYVAITDHTRSLAMTRGSNEAKLRKQMLEIDRLNARLGGIRVLKGAEVNINKDGTLDIDDETLAALDVVGVAVHSYFNLPRAEMTARIIRAMRNPHAHSVKHLPFPRQYGVDQARRGWASAPDVLNTRPVEAFLAALKSDARRVVAGPRNGRTRSRARSRRG